MSLVLLYALVVGQPAEVPALRATATALTTDNAALHATVNAYPQPKPQFCYYGSHPEVCH